MFWAELLQVQFIWRLSLWPCVPEVTGANRSPCANPDNEHKGNAHE